MYVAEIEVELVAQNLESAELEAECLLVIPRGVLSHLVGLLDGTSCLVGDETNVDVVNNIKQWMNQ